VISRYRVAFWLRAGRNAPGVQADLHWMIRPMVAHIRVWIECPACGPYQKLTSEVVLPIEVTTPMLERTCAVCDRCRGLAVMCFERTAGRLN
jgi:hypothetical protein